MEMQAIIVTGGKQYNVKEGDVMPAYYGQENTSCALEACLESVRRRIGWDEKYPCRDMGNGKVRAVGMGMAMQGSGITSVDVGSASLKINDDGFYTLSIGAADMGTGCDTILAQIAAEELGVESYRIVNNCGDQSGQTVKHLHFHVLSGRDMTWPPG